MERIYVDMDRTLCDYDKGIVEFRKKAFLPSEEKHPQSKLGFFMMLEPIPGAIEAMIELQKKYEVWILSRPSFFNMHSYTEKAVWVRNHLGFEMQKKMILCGDKSLLIGDYLIDDMTADGQTEFKGEFIHFGTERYPDWKAVLKQLI